MAHDLRHGRPVALTLLHPELAATLGPDHFEREIRLTARLLHPSPLTRPAIHHTCSYASLPATCSSLRRRLPPPNRCRPIGYSQIPDPTSRLTGLAR